MRRGILILVDCIIIISFSFFLSEIVTYAGGMDYGDEDSIDYGEKYYEELKEGEVLKVQLDNSILISNYDKIATTGTKYRTLGYGIKKQRKVLLKQRMVKLMRRHQLCSINL